MPPRAYPRRARPDAGGTCLSELVPASGLGPDRGLSRRFAETLRRPDHPGAAAQQWLKELYQDNKLFRGELVIDGRLVDLGAVVMPGLNIYSESDTIIHPLASKAMRGRVGSKDYTELPVAGGHIGILVARSKKLGNSIATWLAQH